MNWENKGRVERGDRTGDTTTRNVTLSACDSGESPTDRAGRTHDRLRGVRPTGVVGSGPLAEFASVLATAGMSGSGAGA